MAYLATRNQSYKKGHNEVLQFRGCWSRDTVSSPGPVQVLSGFPTHCENPSASGLGSLTSAGIAKYGLLCAGVWHFYATYVPSMKKTFLQTHFVARQLLWKCCLVFIYFQQKVNLCLIYIVDEQRWAPPGPYVLPSSNLQNLWENWIRVRSSCPENWTAKLLSRPAFGRLAPHWLERFWRGGD